LTKLPKVKTEWRTETDGNRRQRTFVSGAALLRSFRKSSLVACFIAQVAVSKRLAKFERFQSLPLAPKFRRM